MKKKKDYMVPSLEVTRLTTKCCLMAGSATGEQYENGGDPFGGGSAPEVFDLEEPLGSATGLPLNF